ncbi:MAG TPA: 6-phosphogluconolactonase [Acidimicrobiia bacterium]|nr:6-phosphogluconolactonase [Acidimicrobiia bacterium]
MRLLVLEDADALAARAAAIITEHLAAGGDIGLAGGSTPEAAYRNLVTAAIDWPRVDAWMTDERHVPMDHPDSNSGMARRVLFGGVAARLHPVPWDDNAITAAHRYEDQLAAFLPAGSSGPEPSLVILGLGTDGHTASLFPDCPQPEPDRNYTAIVVPGKGWRLTATYDLLARARHTLFLVCGPHKAEALAAVLDGAPLPATRVSMEARDPLWLVDREAAALL